jgi:hypothetical protein
MPNITGIHVSFGSETEYTLASVSNGFLNRPQSRCVEKSIGRWIGPFSLWVVWVVWVVRLNMLARRVSCATSVEAYQYNTHDSKL